MSELTALEVLYLDNNRITDISALAALTKLGEEDRSAWMSEREGGKTHLGLSNNQIWDIGPVVENSGIGGGDGVDLRGNPFNDEAYSFHIPAIQERGVNVLFNPKSSVQDYNRL